MSMMAAPSIGSFLPSLSSFLPNMFNKLQQGPSTLFIGSTLAEWSSAESLDHKGLLVRRPFDGAWDGLDREIDEATARFGEELALSTAIINGDSEQLTARFQTAVDSLLATAELPEALSTQIRADACSIGCAVGTLCPTAREFELKLEIFGHNTCSRWHMDNFVGRAIVSYTGAVGTEYSRDANVDFWELKNCGNNACIIREGAAVESVGVGDFLFIKGTKFPRGAVGLVHKSPEKRFHDDGRVLNRLMLKVDVLSVGQVGADSVGRVGADHGAPTPATTRVVVQRAAKRGRTE